MSSWVNTLRRCKSTVSEPRDLHVLGCELVMGLDPALAYFLPRRDQLSPGSVGKGVHPDRDEHVMAGPQLLARIDPMAVATQPLAVEQVCSGKLETQLRLAEMIDRFPVEALGEYAVAQQGATAGLAPEGEMVASGLCRLGQLHECAACEFRVSFAGGGFD